MSTRLQTKVNMSPTSECSFTTARAGVPQRKWPFNKAVSLAAERQKPSILQRRATNQTEPSMVPPIVHEVLLSPGQQIDAATRAYMEPRFGHDFSRVRVHTDTKAAKSARAVNALAYTVGQHIVFEQGCHAPQTCRGRDLLAHELTHVVNPSHGGILRAVASDYDQIEDGLTYGVFDWVITDEDAHDVLDILAGLSTTDLADTLTQMEIDGLLSRLLENISNADRTAYASLIQTIHQERSTTAVASHIESMMSYGILDWVITDAEAHEALEALKDLRSTPDRLRDIVTSISARQYERFYDNLSEEDRAGNLRFLQDIEMIRRTGMTFAEMSAEQRTHLEAQATAAGVSVGAHIRGEAAARGYGGYVATWWPSLTPAQQASWTARFDAILNRIRVEAPEELRRIVADAESGGGGIQWMPQDVEELGPNTYAFRQGRTLGVGKLWLETAEGNLPDVFENIAHELGGHHEYGSTASWDIMSGTLSSLPPAERTIAESGPRSLFSAYGYMETEIYAELRELPYRTLGSRGDEPATNIEEELYDIRNAFEPSIAEAIVRGLRRRIQLDSRITDEARALFDQKVNDVFGITF